MTEAIINNNENTKTHLTAWRLYPDEIPNKGGLKYVMYWCGGQIRYGINCWHNTSKAWNRGNEMSDFVVAWAKIPKGYKDIVAKIKARMEADNV